MASQTYDDLPTRIGVTLATTALMTILAYRAYTKPRREPAETQGPLWPIVRTSLIGVVLMA